MCPVNVRGLAIQNVIDSMNPKRRLYICVSYIGAANVTRECRKARKSSQCLCTDELGDVVEHEPS